MVRASQAAAARAAAATRRRLRAARRSPVRSTTWSCSRAAARVVILRAAGLAVRADRPPRAAAARSGAAAPPLAARARRSSPRRPRSTWSSANGLGGFTPDGREYVTVLAQGQWTPAPWINVVANPEFGFQVSESGSGTTWSVNSRENKLTPWSNDPVSDTPGETFYVRDEDSGLVWGPTLLPIREEAWPYVIRHGQGYSRFEHTSHGIALDLLQLVPLRDPIKISRLTSRINRVARGGSRSRPMWSGCSACRGVAPRPSWSPSSMPPPERCFARNAWNGEFADRIAFADLGGRQTSWTGDRLEFLGRNASLDHPASLERDDELSGRTGAGLDPCAALQTIVELEPGESTEVLFLLGQGRDAESPVRSSSATARWTATKRCARSRSTGTRCSARCRSRRPIRAMNLLLNRWLLYQTLSCRIWARSAFYQSGGAYGFRDQLQDVLALAVARPDLVREHLLRAAARQFREGDVQHWWHPPTGRGVRTRISDDRLWLPYAVHHYLETTGDAGGARRRGRVARRPAARGRDSRRPTSSPPFPTTGRTLYEHCARALDRSLAVGSHGLPLIGGGDWNDGMNRVGHEGRGESVWLGWFLLANLHEFAPIAERRGEAERAASWRSCAASLRDCARAQALGRRVVPARLLRRRNAARLGAERRMPDRLHLAVVGGALGRGGSGAGAPAMASMEQRLVRRDDRLVLLFAPPFDRNSARPRLHQGLPARHPRERRAVHARRGLVGRGVREARRGRQGRRALPAAESDPPREQAREPAPLQGRAVRRRGGRLLAAAPRRARRLDLVHRRRGLALPRRPRVDPRLPEARGRAAHRSLHSAALEALRDPLPPRPHPLSDRRRESEGRLPRRRAHQLDGALLAGDALIPLSDDGREHQVQVVLA